MAGVDARHASPLLVLLAEEEEDKGGGGGLGRLGCTGAGPDGALGGAAGKWAFLSLFFLFTVLFYFYLILLPLF